MRRIAAVHLVIEIATIVVIAMYSGLAHTLFQASGVMFMFLLFFIFIFIIIMHSRRTQSIFSFASHAEISIQQSHLFMIVFRCF